MTSETAFSNDTVPPASIPVASGIEFHDVSPRYRLILAAFGGVIWLVPMGIWSAIYGRGEIESSIISGPVGYLLPLVILPFLIFGGVLIARATGFALREHDVHLKRGVIWQTHTTLPFNRIQHVEMERGPIERFFGLATLKFFTAGGGSADMKIPALPLDEASRIKNFVLKSAGANHDSA